MDKAIFKLSDMDKIDWSLEKSGCSKETNKPYDWYVAYHEDGMLSPHEKIKRENDDIRFRRIAYGW